MAGRTAPLRVFLSCTSELAAPRGESFVDAAIRAVNRAGHAPDHMQWFGASADTPVDESERRVRGSNLFVGLLGHRYGTEVPDRSGVSYTEAEFDAAVEAGIPRLIFLRDGVPTDVEQRQVVFRAKASEAVVDRFETPGELELRLFAALTRHAEDHDDALVDRLVRILRRDPVPDAARAVRALPPERAARALAEADAQDAADVLGHLASPGIMAGSWAGSALAAMKPRRADAILDLVGDRFTAARLRAARRAATAIADASAKSAALGDATEPMTAAGPSPRNTLGYVQRFARGTITWTPTGGTRVLTADIADCFDRHGGTTGVLGFPIGALQAVPHSPFGTRGGFQEFEGNVSGNGVVRRTEHGAFASWGPLAEYHRSTPGLGFPLGDLVIVPGLAKPGFYQEYEAGIVTWTDSAGGQILRDEIAEEHLGNGGGIVFATGPAEPSPRSPQGTDGVTQRVEVADGAYERGFADRLFAPRPQVVRTTSSLEVDVTVRPAVAYSSDVGGTVVLSDRVDERYAEAGGTGGPLGFPLEAVRWPWPAQPFEGGVMSREGVVVSGAIHSLLRADRALAARLGEPEENKQGAIQFFANGVVTIRNGIAEPWVRP
ncbi:DUF4062 domain-containing protein [Cryptosporangium phraense]|uniref:DUF4062 domain-containing protein n=1 Tax=Cryptosporangium phraense TaxID=2593070 RepID=A0A545AI99_9ACTN|nr:DUF4062 domain-containing protein [Cryptosporangium phraense]TQS41041.1 DUF4062 domain-containing protein [Cryptosporangium phraense]